ncbi:MAG: hypothetical protein FK734_21080 [Asgard group archaeon]|nr:hypothetical protein [Asgard group archaeon]
MIQLKHKKAILIIFLVFLPVATIATINANEPEEIDFIIYAPSPYVQMIMEDMVFQAENLGLIVNTIYYQDPYAMIARMYMGDYDLAYGPALARPYEYDLFSLVTSLTSIDQTIVFHSDNKFTKMVTELEQYLLAVETTSEEDMPDLLNDIINKFHDAEERLWEKQLLIPLGYSYEYMPGYTVYICTYVNSQVGRVFADDDLRITFSSLIDRTAFLNYWALLPFGVYESYHLFGTTSYHNYELPNCVPT